MNRTTKIIATATVALFAMGGSAWAADCPARPTVPDMASVDGAKVTGKEMEKIATEYDAYQNNFVKFSDCINKEFEESQGKFKTVMDAYSAKNKKK